MEHIVIKEPIQLAHAKIKSNIVIYLKTINLLQGENGCGKSSLFQYLTVHKEIFKNSVSFLPQRPLKTLSNMTVKNCLELYLDKEVEIEEPFHRLKNLYHSKVKELSGGENQLLKLFMCLNRNTFNYVLDEPLAHLDYKTKNNIVQFIQLKKNKTFVIFDHTLLFKGKVQTLKLKGEEIEVSFD